MGGLSPGTGEGPRGYAFPNPSGLRPGSDLLAQSAVSPATWPRGHLVPRQGRSLESRHVSHKADTRDVRRSPEQRTWNALLFYLVLLVIPLAVGFP